MPEKLTIILGSIMALSLVVMAAGYLFLSPAEDDLQVDQELPAASVEQRLATFAEQCTTNLIKRGAMSLENSREQVTAACKCLARDFQEELLMLSVEKYSGFLEFGPERPRVRAAALKCFGRAGLDFIPE